jgi:hypothetical protein
LPVASQRSSPAPASGHHTGQIVDAAGSHPHIAHGACSMRPSPMPAPPNRARVISPKMEPGTDFQVLPPPVAPSASDPEGGGAYGRPVPGARA